MKKFLITVVLIFSAMVSAQNQLEFKDVVKADSIQKDNLYNSALSWFTSQIGPMSGTLQTQDKISGTIIGRFEKKYEPVVFMGRDAIVGKLSFSVTVEVKDGRYRYIVNSFTHEGNLHNRGCKISFGLITQDGACPYEIGSFTCKPTDSGKEETWKDLQTKAGIISSEIIESLKIAMKNGIAKDSEW